MKPKQINLAQLVAVAVTAAIETYVRGVKQSDLDELDLHKHANVSKSGYKNQAIVENLQPLKAKKIAPVPRIASRKFQAIYALKSGQSTFYPLPKKKSIRNWQTHVRGSCYQAKLYSRNAQFVVSQARERTT